MLAADSEILVVDDDADVREALRVLLASEGRPVVTVDSGEAAQAHILARRPALALIDIRMAGIDGLAVTRWMRATLRRFVPVILLTASDDPEMLQLGIDAGANEVLRKPVQPAELRLRVRAMLRIAEMTEELRQAKRRLVQLALTDELTGVSNLRGFRATLMREFHRLGRHEGDLTLCLFDVDRFKPLNDAHGHPAGDAVLVAVARALGAASREMDLVARIGGDEFAVLSPGADASVAPLLAERLRRAPSHVRVPLPGGATVAVTLTCGVASVGQLERCTPDRLLAAADAALYRAKQAGRDCMAQASDRPTSAELADAAMSGEIRLSAGVVQDVIEDESSIVTSR